MPDAQNLALPALGSFLFSREAIPDLEACDSANAYLLDAVRALAFINDRHGRRLVDYKNLRSEELGSVYEALLELLPDVHIEALQFDLRTVSGSERKSTGSYYTPELDLVQLRGITNRVDEAFEQCARNFYHVGLLLGR